MITNRLLKKTSTALRTQIRKSEDTDDNLLSLRRSVSDCGNPKRLLRLRLAMTFL
ncbi:MAG: hypothetical protein HZB81_04165 [Deltaproteobacteria bacterium]|nr:hypothetical protein [Deltaproteobacteria bacterium]